MPLRWCFFKEKCLLFIRASNFCIYLHLSIWSWRIKLVYAGPWNIFISWPKLVHSWPKLLARLCFKFLHCPKAKEAFLLLSTLVLRAQRDLRLCAQEFSFLRFALMIKENWPNWPGSKFARRGAKSLLARLMVKEHFCCIKVIFPRVSVREDATNTAECKLRRRLWDILVGSLRKTL